MLEFSGNIAALTVTKVDTLKITLIAGLVRADLMLSFQICQIIIIYN